MKSIQRPLKIQFRKYYFETICDLTQRSFVFPGFHNLVCSLHKSICQFVLKAESNAAQRCTADWYCSLTSKIGFLVSGLPRVCHRVGVQVGMLRCMRIAERPMHCDNTPVFGHYICSVLDSCQSIRSGTENIYCSLSLRGKCFAKCDFFSKTPFLNLIFCKKFHYVAPCPTSWLPHTTWVL